MMTDINNYLDFVLTMFFCFGARLRGAGGGGAAGRHGRGALEKLPATAATCCIGIFILAALLTPPDAISQCSLAIPMYLLYEGGILMARLIGRRKDAPETPEASDA